MRNKIESLIWVETAYKANQPMSAADAPKGMTFVDFIQDRLDVAKTVKPSRCGWGWEQSIALWTQMLRFIQMESLLM
jgi:hypothetical protein